MSRFVSERSGGAPGAMATVFQFPYRTVAEVSLTSIIKNARTIRTLSQREVIPIIKADAYGHGAVPVGKALVARGNCRMLAVATLDEAVEIRKKISNAEILVLSGFVPHQLDAYRRYRLVPVIHSLYHLRSLQGHRELPQFHLKLDSGMHRLGITSDELGEAIRILKNLPNKVAGVASHFAESENTVSKFIDQQIKAFESMVEALRADRLVQTDARIHLSNSAGALRRKLSQCNAVRPGITLYGISPNPRLPHSADLIPSLQWKARILCFKEIQRGDTVGYGRTYKASRRQRLAIVPVGYADGYPRLLGNRGEILIAGKRAAVRGRVSMDLIAVDASHVSAKEGSLVTLIGRDGKDSISAWDLAHWADTIPYEILCGLSQRVPRLYFE